MIDFLSTSRGNALAMKEDQNDRRGKGEEREDREKKTDRKSGRVAGSGEDGWITFLMSYASSSPE